jgi:hypothetical protein
VTVPMDFRMGELLTLKKRHPCGSYQWEVVRIGMDIGIRCQGCQRRILLPRRDLERRVKSRTGGSAPATQTATGA